MLPTPAYRRDIWAKPFTTNQNDYPVELLSAGDQPLHLSRIPRQLPINFVYEEIITRNANNNRINKYSIKKSTIKYKNDNNLKIRFFAPDEFSNSQKIKDIHYNYLNDTDEYKESHAYTISRAHHSRDYPIKYPTNSGYDRGHRIDHADDRSGSTSIVANYDPQVSIYNQKYRRLLVQDLRLKSKNTNSSYREIPIFNLNTNRCISQHIKGAVPRQKQSVTIPEGNLFETINDNDCSKKYYFPNQNSLLLEISPYVKTAERYKLENIDEYIQPFIPKEAYEIRNYFKKAVRNLWCPGEGIISHVSCSWDICNNVSSRIPSITHPPTNAVNLEPLCKFLAMKMYQECAKYEFMSVDFRLALLKIYLGNYPNKKISKQHIAYLIRNMFYYESWVRDTDEILTILSTLLKDQSNTISSNRKNEYVQTFLNILSKMTRSSKQSTTARTATIEEHLNITYFLDINEHLLSGHDIPSTFTKINTVDKNHSIIFQKKDVMMHEVETFIKSLSNLEENSLKYFKIDLLYINFDEDQWRDEIEDNYLNDERLRYHYERRRSHYNYPCPFRRIIENLESSFSMSLITLCLSGICLNGEKLGDKLCELLMMGNEFVAVKHLDLSFNDIEGIEFFTPTKMIQTRFPAATHIDLSLNMINQQEIKNLEQLQQERDFKLMCEQLYENDMAF